MESQNQDMLEELSSREQPAGSLDAPTQGAARAQGQEGFVLLLSLLAMAALTVLGVAAVTSSSIDLKIAHNMRRMEQARYASVAGLEDARRYMILGIMPSQTQVTYFDDPSTSASAFIDEGDAIVMTQGDGRTLGTYSVNVEIVKCGGPPAGYSVDQFYSQFFDLRSTGVLKDAAGKTVAPATATTVLTLRKVREGRCIKR